MRRVRQPLAPPRFGRRRRQLRSNKPGGRDMPVAIENRIRRRIAQVDVVRKIGKQQIAERAVASPVRADRFFAADDTHRAVRQRFERHGLRRIAHEIDDL